MGEFVILHIFGIDKIGRTAYLELICQMPLGVVKELNLAGT